MMMQAFAESPRCRCRGSDSEKTARMAFLVRHSGRRGNLGRRMIQSGGYENGNHQLQNDINDQRAFTPQI